MSVKVAKFNWKTQERLQIPGYTTVLIHVTNNGIAGDLSPFNLKDENGAILENIWQFSKLYPKVNVQNTPLSKYRADQIIWSHPSEKHIDTNGNPNQNFWKWRQKGFQNRYAVRYPNGFYGRHKCVCAIWGTPDNYQRLNYIEARKKIYCGEYARLAPLTKGFKRMKKMLENGENILIIEVDGPDPSLTHAPYDQISADNPALDINEENIRLLIDDETRPFGHGFTIAALLLGLENLITG